MTEAKLRFDLNPEKLTLNDYILIEEDALKSARQMRDLLARLVVDKDGNPIPPKEARAWAGGLNLIVIREVMGQLVGALQTIKDAAVSGEA